MTAPKWKIRNLQKHLPLKEAANRILKTRISRLRLLIRKYLRVETAEDLHQIRIAIRRLRYSMELFTDCYSKKKFFAFYQLIESLQDITGLVRDNFLMKEKLDSFAKMNPDALPLVLLEQIASEAQALNDKMKNELIHFIGADESRLFRHLLK